MTVELTGQEASMCRHYYFDEIMPAKTDFFVEAGMVTKLMRLEPSVSFKRAQAIVNDIVHVANHYTVVEHAAPAI